MKKLTLTLSAAMLSLGLAAHAQSLNVDNDNPPSPDSGAGISSFAAGSTAAAQAVTAGTVSLSRPFTLDSGHYVDLRLATNYALDTASKVAISIVSNKQNLAGTFLVPYFAAPGSTYTAVDAIDCYWFDYYTQGGATVPVYGTHLVVRVYNYSGTRMTYNQVLVRWNSN